jgi:hypothetical protein
MLRAARVRRATVRVGFRVDFRVGETPPLTGGRDLGDHALQPAELRLSSLFRRPAGRGRWLGSGTLAGGCDLTVGPQSS